MRTCGKGAAYPRTQHGTPTAQAHGVWGNRRGSVTLFCSPCALACRSRNRVHERVAGLSAEQPNAKPTGGSMLPAPSLSAVPASPRAPTPFLAHEWGLGALGLCVGVALGIQGAWALAAEAALTSGVWAAVCLGSARVEGATLLRLRMVATYLWVLWLYLGLQRITPALGLPIRDAALLAVDRALLGETPAVLIESYASPWLTDVLSGCYLFYLVYLHAALLMALLGDPQKMLRLGRMVFLAYVPGLALYILVPARGPGADAAGLFHAPLRGGALTALNATVVAQGSSTFDVFPSLHVLITLALLTHDRWWNPRRFRAVLLPCIGLGVSTLYLRYHYAADVLAAFLLWMVLVRAWRGMGLGKAPSGAPRV
jgi:hypothetical protein